MKPNEYSQIEYEAHKTRLRELIEKIKLNREIDYKTELDLYLLLCDTYYHTEQ